MTAADNPPIILRVLATCVAAVKRSGELIRDIVLKHNISTSSLTQEKLCLMHTEVERSAEKCIFATLVHHFPALKFSEGAPEKITRKVPKDWIVEEPDQEILNIHCPSNYLELTFDDIIFWTNPLEGKEEFKQGLLHQVSILIGLAVKGKAVAGIIQQPFYNYYDSNSNISLGRTVWGLVGYGISGFQTNLPPPDSLRLVTTRFYINSIAHYKVVDALQPNKIRRVGGIGYKVLLLAEGNAHAFVFVSKGCEKSDTCAAEAILKAVGGRLTDVHGKEYSYGKDVEFANRRGVFATARGVDYHSLITKIPADIRKLLE